MTTAFVIRIRHSSFDIRHSSCYLRVHARAQHSGRRRRWTAPLASGAYGNTSFPTPALDHFAAESFLLDWCYAASADLAEIYRTLWQSRERFARTAT